MSKTRLTAAFRAVSPAKMIRVIKVFPVPVFPKMALLRSASLPKSMQTGLFMSSGVPILKKSGLKASEPKIRAMSSSCASYTGEQCVGTVFTGKRLFSLSSMMRGFTKSVAKKLFFLSI